MNIYVTNGTSPTDMLMTHVGLLELIRAGIKPVMAIFFFLCNLKKWDVVVDLFTSTFIVTRAHVGLKIQNDFGR